MCRLGFHCPVNFLCYKYVCANVEGIFQCSKIFLLRNLLGKPWWPCVCVQVLLCISLCYLMVVGIVCSLLFHTFMSSMQTSWDRVEQLTVCILVLSLLSPSLPPFLLPFTIILFSLQVHSQMLWPLTSIFETPLMTLLSLKWRRLLLVSTVSGQTVAS